MVARSLITLMAACVLGCSDQREASQPTSARLTASPSEQSQRPGFELHEGLDAVFDSIAQRAPGFAGAFFDRGTCVILLKDARDEAASREGIASFLVTRIHTVAAAKLPVTLPPFTVRSAKYSWRELMVVRDMLAERFGDSTSTYVTSLDANERENHVTVGVADAAFVDEARSAIRGLGITDDIAIVQVHALAHFDQGITLDDRWRPLLGGTNFGSLPCTMTVGAFLNGQPVALTNSHCTAVDFTPDGGPTKQPVMTSAPAWGQEVQDLPTYRCGPWYARKDCRRADLAAYSLAGIDLLEGEIGFTPGVIARPEQRLPGVNMTYGSLVMAGPAIGIVGFIDDPLMGEIVDRVGQTTGWQFGSVYETCSDKWMSRRTSSRRVLLVCQSTANTFSEPGDSGSPVFLWLPDNSTAILMGINWGSNTNDASGFFSSMRQMRQEMPTLCFAFGC